MSMFSPDPLQTPFQVKKSTLKNSVLEKLITVLSGFFFIKLINFHMREGCVI